MFVQKLNALTGESEWVVVEEAGAGGEHDASAELVAGSSYLDMLTDGRRNEAYAMAVERALARISRSSHQATMMSEPATPQVLDIGTGTGLLAMMAAKAVHSLFLSRPVDTCTPPESLSTSAPAVVACEVFPPMAAIARRVIASNNLQETIKVVPKRSDELTVASTSPATSGATPMAAGSSKPANARRAPKAPDPDMPGLADLVVSEILDSELLGEGVLPTMRHASTHLMKPGAVAIPASATLWAQLVDCPLLWQMASLGPHCRADDINTASPSSGQQTDSSAAGQHVGTLVQQVVDTLRELDGKAHLGAVSDDGLAWQDLHELHIDPLHASGELQPLTAPFQLKHVDLTRPAQTNPDRVDVQVAITGTGHLHALVYWWQLHLDDQQPPLLLSTAPSWVGSALASGGDGGPLNGVAQQWRDHWKQCWAPLGATTPELVQPGDQATISVKHGDTSVQVALCCVASSGGAAPTHPAAPTDTATPCLPPLRHWLPPSLLAELHNMTRWTAYAQAILPRVQSHSHVSDVVVLGSSLMLPLLSAAVLRAAVADQAVTPNSKVQVLMEGGAERQWIMAAAEVMGLAGSVGFVKPGPFMKRLRHQQSQPQNGGEAGAQPVTLVVSEPRFLETAGSLPWLTLMRYWSDVQTMIRSGHFAGPVVCIPGCATIKAMVVSLPELWRTRCSLDKVAGFNLLEANGVLGCVNNQAVESSDEPKTFPQACEFLAPLPACLWQCGGGCRELSGRVDLLRVDVHQEMKSLSGQSRLQVTADQQAGGVGHAVVVWVEYECRGDPQGRGEQQGLFLLHKPLQVGQALQVEVQVEAERGQVDFAFHLLSN